MKSLILLVQLRFYYFFKKSLKFISFIFLLGMVFIGQVSAQTVTVTGTENNIPITEVRYTIEGNELIQTSPDGNENPSPADVPVVISSITIDTDKVIYATTRNPTVENPNPIIGSATIRSDAIQIVHSDNTITSHLDDDFISGLETVVSTPDIRSYWDINGQPSIPQGEAFVDLEYKDQVVTSGYLLYTERNGNSATDFIALDRNGNPIEGAKRIQVRGFQWNTGINHVTNVPTQTQYMVLFSPSIFESTEPIFGIRIIAENEPDGKLVFFVNAISATPDLKERVNSELGGDAVLNVYDNDELNGFPLNPIDVTLEIVNPFPISDVTLNLDGTVDVAPNTPPGEYKLVYKITTGGGDSDEAEVTIEVIEYIPIAMDDAFEQDDSFGKENILNVLDNDLLNGLPALIENVNLSTLSNDSDGKIILNADGSIDIVEGIPSGNYELVYQICDKEDPAKCDQATVSVTINPTVLEAIEDNYGSVNANRAGEIGNVLSNDQINGEAVSSDRVHAVLTDNDGLTGVSLAEDGTLTLPTGLPEGNYVLLYDLVETINPSNKDEGEIKFSLQDVQLEAKDDEVVTNQNEAVTIAVLDNDFTNSGAILDETLLITEDPVSGVISIADDGLITYTPETNFSGTDSFVYEICENADRMFCDQAKVTILVRPILLELNKTASATEIPIDGVVTYTITITNNSAFDLSDIQVEDPLPSGLLSMGTVPAQGTDGSWILTSLSAGESASFQIEAMGVEKGEKVNTATISVGEFTDQVTAPTVTVVAKQVDISISKTSFGKAIYEGNEFEYEIKLTNNGLSSAEDVVVSDQLPSNVEFLGFTGIDPGATVSGNTISWTVASIAAGEELVYVISVQATGLGTVTNTVTVEVPDNQDNISTSKEDSDTNQIIRFFVPNVITPGNVDGKNDTFEIKGIQNFAKNSLTILNRNGDHVFEMENYHNDWAAEGLNSGAYFYVLIITDNSGEEQTYKGWVQVIK
ncbi:T9SS type B sorting domain-containing protein [Cyclobacterium marinum]|uniref:Conserved repeat domain protein n=1 Tax=Cyclobacterium marinum (strain ATCC 25205 / DSM 745 / LMG 13164 / NCIMB 1802) TaxID=880070 RepID=G0J0Y3_CYCMS|nr:gliding motility-associated C-terminal domain-containing protein [Cyclobacterium marinum]AEL25109.1 conserved repeat domain protein [Cyclobacterium marinum DSM 745]